MMASGRGGREGGGDVGRESIIKIRLRGIPWRIFSGCSEPALSDAARCSMYDVASLSVSILLSLRSTGSVGIRQRRLWNKDGYYGRGTETIEMGYRAILFPKINWMRSLLPVQ